MIRPFTVFCKLNQISFSDRQWLEKEAGSLSHTDGICPVCHAKACLSPFASYTRYLVEWKDALPATHEVSVQRYRCSSCGHTHALLSSALVPYSSYSLRFILLVLRDYFLGRVCIQKICESAGICVSTFYRWKAQFLKHKALWLGVLEDIYGDACGNIPGRHGRYPSAGVLPQVPLLFPPAKARHIPGSAAGNAGACVPSHIRYAKGIARICRTGDVQMGITNKRLAEFGLISMSDYYTKRHVTC